ncbi:MAG TPA: polysaccharide lyase [Sphingobacteriaceae bacterium]
MKRNKLIRPGLKGVHVLFFLQLAFTIGCTPEPLESVFAGPADSVENPSPLPPTVPSIPAKHLVFKSSFEESNSLSDLYLEGATSQSITRSKEQARTGSYSARFILNKTDKIVGGSKRSEALLEWVETPRFERWYGMSIFLPASYVPDPAEEQLFQWHAISSVDLDGRSMVNSPMAMYTKYGRWVFSAKFGGDFDLGAYDRNAWTDWVIHVKFSHESDGILEIWKNGKLVVQRFDRTNFRDLKGNFFKIGVYKYAWAEDYQSTTTNRTLYYDNVKIGAENASYSDVAPSAD